MLPSYKDMMLPILEFVAQKKEANRAEISKFIIKHFKLKDEDLLQKIKRGTPTYKSYRLGLILSGYNSSSKIKARKSAASKSW